jgi:CRISPR/Cas system-associated protein endoribonuclease Cas2
MCRLSFLNHNKQTIKFQTTLIFSTLIVMKQLSMYLRISKNEQTIGNDLNKVLTTILLQIILVLTIMSKQSQKISPYL